jgi:hypothetical protein
MVPSWRVSVKSNSCWEVQVLIARLYSGACGGHQTDNDYVRAFGASEISLNLTLAPINYQIVAISHLVKSNLSGVNICLTFSVRFSTVALTVETPLLSHIKGNLSRPPFKTR